MTKDRGKKKKQTEATQEVTTHPKPRVLRFYSNSPQKSQDQSQSMAEGKVENNSVIGTKNAV